jgi:hypothetical protein
MFEHLRERTQSDLAGRTNPAVRNNASPPAAQACARAQACRLWGRPHKLWAANVLPSEPELSQVEAWARWGNHLGCGQGSYNFSETAKETLRRAQGAVSRVVARTCELPLPLWRARRTDPAMLPQPVEQWPRLPCVTPSGFGGFLPDSFPVDLRTLVGSPDMVRRMKVAALDDESMHLWHQR